MQINLTLLHKTAIDAALKEKWHEAESLNRQILENKPEDLDAKNRLGRAYIHLGEFSKAKKILKEVLESDPINTVALKNFKIASEKKYDKFHTSFADPRALIIEPGTTTEVDLIILAKRITADNFYPGESIEVKLDKNSISFYKKGILNVLGSLNSDLLKRLQAAKKTGGTFSASYLNGKDKNIKVLMRSSIPIFKAERQDVRPYVKKGTFEEPELEIPIETEE